LAGHVGLLSLRVPDLDPAQCVFWVCGRIQAMFHVERWILRIKDTFDGRDCKGNLWTVVELKARAGHGRGSQGLAVGLRASLVSRGTGPGRR